MIGIARTLEEDAADLYKEGFDLLLSIQEKPIGLEAALENAPQLLERTGERIGRMLGICI